MADPKQPPARTLEEMAFYYRVSTPFLHKVKEEGWDIYDARRIIERLLTTTATSRPKEWLGVFDKIVDAGDDDSHEALKKEKTRQEVIQKKIANAKAQGDSFDRKDGDAVMASWIAALNLAHIEMQAMVPPQLEGLTAAKIEEFMGQAFHTMRENLADLSSELWNKVYEHYIPGYEESPDDASGGGNGETRPAPKRVKVVREKRQTGSGTNAES